MVDRDLSSSGIVAKDGLLTGVERLLGQPVGSERLAQKDLSSRLVGSCQKTQGKTDSLRQSLLGH